MVGLTSRSRFGFFFVVLFIAQGVVMPWAGAASPVARPMPEDELATGISAIMNSKLDGLSLLEMEEREQLRKDARQYIRFRRNPKSSVEREAWRARCQGGAPTLYCRAEDLESASLALAEKRHGRSRTPQEEQRQVMNALLEGDLDLLEEVSDSAISKVFSRTPRRDAFVALEKAVLESKPCNSVRVATLMGSKFEEFLPGRESLDAAIGLYQKAASCDSNPEFTERARYRAALLLISREDWSAAIPLLEKLARNKEYF